MLARERLKVVHAVDTARRADSINAWLELATSAEVRRAWRAWMGAIPAWALLSDPTHKAQFATYQGKFFRLIDREHVYVAFATWDQMRESLAASPEGWIKGPVMDCYVEGNPDEMAKCIAAYDAREK